jgi:hypothetical protein
MKCNFLTYRAINISIAYVTIKISVVVNLFDMNINHPT